MERFCRSTGANPLRAFLKVRLPAALPQCFVGFKYAAINATVGATIAEFIGSDQGLGFYIQIVTGNMRPDLAFAGIFLLTLLGLALFGNVTLVERLVIPWHISVRRAR
jgi:NitT/TauT family transport system permease protein